MMKQKSHSTLKVFLLFVFTLIILVIVFTTACKEPANKPACQNPEMLTIKYDVSDENIANPERGFAMQFDPPWPDTITWEFCEQDDEDYTWTAWNDPITPELLFPYKEKKWTMINARYHLAEFRHSRISDVWIARFQEDLNVVREQGMKLILRFAYNYPMGGPDAPIDQVLLHIDQLEPILKDNIDVIAYFELGFIGPWGEGHTSSYGLQDTKKGYNRINEKTIRIIERFFYAIPEYRMIAIRYPEYKFQYFNGLQEDPLLENAPIEPLTEETAFDGSIRSRLGVHDDCLVCGEWNSGTFWNPRNNAEEVMEFLTGENKWVIQGGEPGGEIDGSDIDKDGDGFTRGEYAQCDRVLSFFKKMHWSTCNGGWGAKSYDQWESEGCFEEIQNKLGYRLRLVEARLPKMLNNQEDFKAEITLTNDGWAAPYNPRIVELILRNSDTREIGMKIVLCGGEYDPLEDRDNDPRFWQPEKEIKLSISKRIPEELAPGEYDVILNLPDPLLYERAEYKIRLANKNTWEAETGYNIIKRRVKISQMN